MNLLFVLGVLAGLGLLVFMVIFYQRGSARHAAASRWTKTEAVVIAATLGQHTSGGGESGSQVSYRPWVHYRYHAGGVEREGKRTFLCARSDFRSQRAGEQWMAPFTEGARVPVWFDPANPDDAALELNKPSLVMVVALGGAGVFLAIVFAYLAMKP